jgi:hypothetical protein
VSRTSAGSQDLYRSDVLREVAAMKREGVYVCMANVIKRMPTCHQDILWSTLWSLAREGRLS